ncbi:HotDog domain-containing protein [Kalaharituber pfeilii]|nr:HotDog domain-containing protein [Kalaharituber pfeilii]
MAPIGSQGKVIHGAPVGDTLTLFERVQAFLNAMCDDAGNGFGSNLIRDGHLVLTSARLIPTPSGPTSVLTFELTVHDFLCNRMGNLHGGATALLIDVTTTCALVPIAKPGFWQYAGVSRNLSVTYLRPAPMGSTIVITAEVVQAGKTVCTVRGVVTDKKSGKVLSIAEHGKISIDPPMKDEEEERKEKVRAKL